MAGPLVCVAARHAASLSTLLLLLLLLLLRLRLAAQRSAALRSR
jgi:hypothetical protein